MVWLEAGFSKVLTPPLVPPKGVCVPAASLSRPRPNQRTSQPPSSRLRKLTSAGGKPSPNSSTRIPAHFAVIKCPNSCTSTSKPKTGMAASKYQLFILLFLYFSDNERRHIASNSRYASYKQSLHSSRTVLRAQEHASRAVATSGCSTD